MFPTTHWSVIRRASGGMESEVKAALTELCRAYWYPLYAYVRRSGHAVHDAQDLTQAFIVALIDGPLLSRADPDKGRFRSFIIVALRRFMANEYRRQKAECRGGHIDVVSLDETRDESRLALESTDGLTPDDHFERAWAFALLDAVLGRLRAEYEAAGRGELFAALHPYLAGRHGQAQYAVLSEQFGLSENTLSASVYRMRRRYGEILREEITRTVGEAGEVEEEIAYLMRVVAR